MDISKRIYYAAERSGIIRDEGPGLIHIYYGDGVGKTTSAIGLALRAAGAGLKTDFVQFMKSGKSSEVTLLNSIPRIRYCCPGAHPFIMSGGPKAVHYNHANRAFEYALEAVQAENIDVLICDEILDTLIFNILTEDRIRELMEACREKIELVMTGRDAPQAFIETADYVTEFVHKKHPYYRGVRARKGFEF